MTQSSLPAFRRLQIYTLDPSSETRTELSFISRSVLALRWEELRAGPVGEYLEVIDIDPASGLLYKPVNLNHHVASDGLDPSVGDPGFHQQMVYAIAMRTIETFEYVLGRPVLWAEHRRNEYNEHLTDAEQRYVQRLRVYPHGLRGRNAYYSPAKKAILFGYFNAAPTDTSDAMPGGLIFTCLSHDIVAHETSHAILDALAPKLLRVSNPDMLAFHEAFADLVAIFEHFALPGLLEKEIVATRGDLWRNNLLAKLAMQFAWATGGHDALRNALGEYDEVGHRKAPDPEAMQQVREPHARGAILVAAVFDAFLLVYEHRVADLRRIATNGTGVLPDGDIHPDLARRFASEAVKVATRMLKICIRGLDYLPPVDVTFGDFLRAIITADRDAVPRDPHNFRVALIESFREKRIYPHDVRSLSEESLRWRAPRLQGKISEKDRLRELLPPRRVLKSMAEFQEISRATHDRLAADPDVCMKNGGTDADKQAVKAFLATLWLDDAAGPCKLDAPRYRSFLARRCFARFMHQWISHKLNSLSGPEQEYTAQPLGLISDNGKIGVFEVLGVEYAQHPRSDGAAAPVLKISIAQRITHVLETTDGDPVQGPNGKALHYRHRSGVTLLIDPDSGEVLYAVRKGADRETMTPRRRRHSVFLQEELERQGLDAIAHYGLDEKAVKLPEETFAMAHRSVHHSQKPVETY